MKDLYELIGMLVCTVLVSYAAGRIFGAIYWSDPFQRFHHKVMRFFND